MTFPALKPFHIVHLSNAHVRRFVAFRPDHLNMKQIVLQTCQHRSSLYSTEFSDVTGNQCVSKSPRTLLGWL